MKILIAGGGKIGSTLTRHLCQEDHEITVIDRNLSVLENMVESFDISFVEGNAASMETLLEAGVKEANLFIVATDKDEVNLLACMTAHGINPKIHTICRIRNPEYRVQAIAMRDTFALNMIMNPDEQAAMEISRLLKYPGFLTIDTFVDGRVEIVEMKILEDSRLNGVSLNRLSSIVHCNVLVCAVLRNGKCIMPDGNFVLQQGDRIYVTASTNNLHQLLRNLNIISRKNRRVFIAGGSRISYYLAKELGRSNISCTIIEKDLKRCELLANTLEYTTILHGDASNQSFLESLRLSKEDALVTLTDLDEVNIVISLYANATHVNQIVTKLSHTLENEVLESLPIGSIVSPKDLVALNIVRYVRAMENQQGAAVTIHQLAQQKADSFEFRVTNTTKYQNIPLKDIPIKKNVLVVSIAHKDHVEIPNGNSTFEEKDSLVVVTSANRKITTLNDIFEE